MSHAHLHLSLGGLIVTSLITLTLLVSLLGLIVLPIAALAWWW